MPRTAKPADAPDMLKLKQLVKAEEKRVFFMYDQPELDMNDLIGWKQFMDQEQAAALGAKVEFEKTFGLKIIRFYRDPMAGGLTPDKSQPSQFQPRDLDGAPVGPTKTVYKIMKSLPAWVGEWL